MLQALCEGEPSPIVSIHLGTNRVADWGASTLGEALPPLATVLVASGTLTLGFVGQALGKAPNLTSLCLGGNRIEEWGVEASAHNTGGPGDG